MTSNVPIPRFNVGEVSPSLWGRLDLAQYSAAAKLARNVLLLPQGGFTRRGGFRHVAEVKDNDKPARLVPFVYSNTDRYAFEFGDRYIRFFYEQGQLKAEAVDTAITNGEFTDDISGWTDASTTAVTDPVDPGTPISGTDPPSAPRNLNIEPWDDGDTTVRFSWEAPASSGAGPIIRYEVQTQYRVGGFGGVTTTVEDWISVGLNTSHSYTVSSNADAVFVRVRAANAVATGPHILDSET